MLRSTATVACRHRHRCCASSFARYASTAAASTTSDSYNNAGTTLQDALSDRAQPRRFRKLRNNKNTSRIGSSSSSSEGSNPTTQPAGGPIRLSKRMSELDLCSRREADRLIEAGRVIIDGVPVEPALGLKVDPTLTDIVIVSEDDSNDVIRPLEFDWHRMRGDTVVLNKPTGYVSGQPEMDTIGGKGRHEPAVRLLTRANLAIRNNVVEDQELQEILSDGNCLHFSRRFGYSQTHTKKSQRLGKTSEKEDDSWWNDNDSQSRVDATLTNYVPAGRLDLDSTGLLIFTKNGVMAKKLISPHGLIDKEYVVRVEPVQSLTRTELEMGMTSLPQPTRDLTPLLHGGATLFGEHRVLRPVVEAEWLSEDQSDEEERSRRSRSSTGNDGKRRFRSKAANEKRSSTSVKGGTLRIVLNEGMKRHIRRACRELLGMHVVSLERTKIGNIRLDIPEGKWRPLREAEARSIYEIRDN